MVLNAETGGAVDLGEELTMVGALNRALARAMQDDDTVVLLGEDIGVNGGVFRVTDGLLNEFGDRRVIDTPLAEITIAGAAVGMAVEGLKSVVEIQFSGFMYSVIDHIVNHAARLRNRTRGEKTCPMVLRMPVGGGIHAPEHHSESVETYFAHTPGLRVVIPSSPRKAYGLLLAAIQDPDPVVFLEPTRLYRLGREKVEDDGVALPLDVAFVLREGSDITLVSWGASLVETLQAAEELAKDGVSAEVIDVATLKYMDEKTILESVKKTGRVVVVHEASYTGGFGGEIIKRVAKHCLLALLAPPDCVAGYDTVMPLSQLEKQYIPSVERIVAAARDALKYS
ncbi:2-oxoisovalerate dehydrogenase [Candidatus Kaiserbacteria bacterium RIFCSPHIGHO2_01_FULL_50_13]|uniref:2-oxoisovalerate dehydrogenase n=1 Tax=Candidatus Kaiserbacteria bacterium RIFCSPLOWO2_01_FULL_50_24 TaxID=1798507 RepID=A0A1F6EMD7_9BACT|nr:MAG: 2-oxoisovalerate dehydrogenase [Candidatus Kaiserbacteria bacterium RIFCSPHIGHO2_01_FULL_50_13]OGG74806.1 MAG: 2-oxoisovalerate dehydrogenase [Candidatus Kaiserbacteria bacterium RIFCSPLOWO2_01_FULL_50_24]OGG81389.1 MAG: 2-oxoisovalerate dehydrogenase [Candidatus Kaiserbacteria bacterium RIFCSPLOWO2_02_FULL_51_13]